MVLSTATNTRRCRMSLKPSLQAMWLADDVSVDEATGKVTVSGIFNQIEIKAPETAFTSQAYLFFALSDVRTAADLRLCYVDLRTLEVLRERPIRVECADPLGVTDVLVEVNSMPVPHPGAYAWELYFGSEM